MATLPVAHGSLFAAKASLGPTNQEFQVDVEGNVIFEVGPSTAEVPGVFPNLMTPTYSILPGTGLSESTKNSDVGLLLNQWLDNYLLNTPPAPRQVGTAISDTQKLQIDYTLPPQKKLAFSATTAPYIQHLRADVVRTSLNGIDGALNWTDPSKFTITIETIAANNFASVTSLQMYVDAGVNTITGNTYKYYGLPSDTEFDIRIYGTNQSDQALQYLNVFAVKTLPVGKPVAPTNLLAAPTSSTAATSSWTAPVDNDDNTPGNQTTPFISQYKLTQVPSSTARYLGLVNATPVDSLTTLTSGSPSATSLALTSLLPGTQYSLTVAAKNAINATYSPSSTPATLMTTNYPTAPTYISTSDASSLNSLVTLRDTYSSSGGYSIDGVTQIVGATTPIINYTKIDETNLRTTAATAKRINFTEGATGTVGTLLGYGGLTSAYTSAPNTASYTVLGFGGTNSGSTASSGTMTRVNYNNDVDAYTGNNAGFYKTLDVYAQGVNVSTYYTASTAPYSLRMQYTPVGGSAVQTTQVQFYIDNANTATSISNLGVIAETASGTTRISGVPTFTSSATFKVQFNQAEIAHYFLRPDRKHAELVVTTSGNGSTLSSTVPVSQTDIGATHKYFTVPATPYNTSASASTALAATSTPPVVQFNTFTVALNAAGNVFNEALEIRARPYSLFSASGGTQVVGSYLNVSTGASSPLRIDTASVTADRTAASNALTATGQHMSSDTGPYPTGGYTTAYNHATDISTNSDLQLVNGRYQTAAGASDGYKNYTAYYCGALTGPNYTALNTSAIRWVTFKYAGRITSGSTFTKVRLSIVQSGLTVNFDQFDAANHFCQIKVVDATHGTAWLSCTDRISGVGLQDGQTNGTNCIDLGGLSTASQRDCTILAGTPSSAVFFVRIGIANNVAASITSVTLTPVINFT